ncbi:MAG: VWA domain-containing protein, partial [Caldilineae bacterium]
MDGPTSFRHTRSARRGAQQATKARPLALFRLCPQASFHFLTNLAKVFPLVLAGLLIFTGSGAAQIIEPPHPPTPPPIFPVGPGRIQVDQYSLDAVIDGPLAVVTVQQVFRNTGQRTVEGAYIFPVPANASPGDLQLTVDGQTLEGRLYPADEAERIYTEIVRRQRDPALLAYVGRGLYQTRVFPIPPGASRTVTLTYRHVLEQDDGLYRFDAPVPGAGDPDRAPKRFALRVDLRNQPGLRTVYSPSHNVSIQREGPDGALVGFETTDPAEMRPFALYFGTDASALGVNLLSYRPAGEDGFFLLLAAPAVDAGAQALVARDVILVLDVSGSMQGDKIEQARAAARYVVDHLNPDDRFNLVRFSTGVDVWQARLQPVDADARQRAHQWIDATRATGSTDINRALLEALALLREPTDRPAYILFLTDGLPTVGVQEPERILDNATTNAPQDRAVRLFTFGVGYDVNTDLLDELSRSLGGTSTYVQPDQRIDEAVSDFYAGVSAPVLAQVQ